MSAAVPLRPQAPPLLLPSNRPLVRTDMFVLALAKMEAITRLSTIGLIEGAPGTGKTTVVRYHAQTKGHRVAVIEIPSDSSSKVSLKHAHRALTGYDPAGDKHEIQDTLVDLLGKGGWVIVIDEAQHLGLAGIKQVVTSTTGAPARPSRSPWSCPATASPALSCAAPNSTTASRSGTRCCRSPPAALRRSCGSSTSA